MRDQLATLHASLAACAAEWQNIVKVARVRDALP
jgi:hypothetical protein